MPQAAQLATDDERNNNLPPQISGALPQAKARKDARRGGTPNAPEVDDEAAPATNNGSALPQKPAQPQPQTIASNQPTPGSLASYMPGGQIASQIPSEVAAAYRTGGAGPAIGEAVRGVGASMVGAGVDVGNIAGNIVRPWLDTAANAARTAFTGNQQPLATPAPASVAGVATPAPAVTPKPGPGETPGATALPPVEARPSSVPDSAPVQPAPVAPVPVVASNLPAGITRTGNSYTGTSAGMGGADAGGAIAAPAMTTEQANQFYGAQRAAMEAKEAQDIQANHAQSEESTNKRAAALEADQIKNSSELFALRNASRGSLLGAGAAARTATELTGRANTLDTFARAPSAIPQRNLIGEAATQGASVQTQQQNALTNPLHAAQLQQQLKAGGTAQKIAELTLAGHETEQTLRKKLETTTDPEERMAIRNDLLSMAGKPPHEPWKLHAEPGHTDPISGTYQPGYAIAIHGGTGETKNITSDVTPQPIKQELVEGQQFKGAKGTPEEGRFWKVINKQRVETDAAGNPLKK